MWGSELGPKVKNGKYPHDTENAYHSPYPYTIRHSDGRQHPGTSSSSLGLLLLLLLLPSSSPIHIRCLIEQTNKIREDMEG